MPVYLRRGLWQSVAMSPVELLRSPTLADSAPYAYASRVGELVFTAGACPLDEAGEVVAPGDVAARPRG